MAKAQFGSDVVVDMMQSFGIQYAALNPGSSYRGLQDRKSTRLNSSHIQKSRMPSSA